ncbi:SDR family oxidoreductase [Actinotalea sp. BY-33]|uniref:SDR family oxidoreductase n=1 Tax=Actinotalea soli TaxID=2819234 RepID=A0A939LPA4_9CELL|nr:SDR family oxidoreductase [Actinotalea soli]MBO1751349.1 SDR family oxidoreductase [Actinotalea soli]
MTDAPALAVTGATGKVGGLVARAVAAAGVPQRLLVRDPRRAPDLPGAEVRQVAYGQDAMHALEGVEVLFMVSGAESADRVAEHRAFIDDAAEAGVDHVVYTSFLGASPTSTFLLGRDHAATEEHLRRAGLRHTLLRDNLYLDVLPEFVGPDGALRGPAGDGRLGAVARADVARVATTVLLDPRRHAGRTYDLTGPEALSLDEVAATITEVTGREVRYVPETLAEAYASRSSYGAPDWQVDAWVSTYTAIAAGEMAAVTDHVERVTGQPPLSLRALLRP